MNNHIKNENDYLQEFDILFVTYCDFMYNKIKNLYSLKEERYMKKILLGIMLLCILPCFACANKGFRIEKDLIEKYADNLKSNQCKINYNEIKEFNKEGLSIFDNNEFLFLFSFEEKYAVYSLLENDYVTEFMDADIYFKNVDTYYPEIYIYEEVLETIDDSEYYVEYLTVLDAKGNVLLPRDKYDYAVMSLVTINNIKYKKLTYSIDDKKSFKYFEIGESEITLTEMSFSIDKENLSNLERVSLDEYGFKGFSISIIDFSDKKLIKVYKKDKLYNEYYIGKNNCIFVDKYIIYQNIIELSNDSKKYDFIEYNNGELSKYDLVTYRIDLLTGKEKEIETDLLFNNYNLIENNKGISNYSIVYGNYIEDKTVKYNINKKLVVDKNLDVVCDLALYPNFMNFNKLDDNLYILDGVIYNSKLEVIFDLNNNENDIFFSAVNLDQKLLICEHNGYYGALDYNFNIVIPFIYDSINNLSYDGIFTGVVDGNACIINLDGTNTILNEYQKIEMDMLIEISEEADENGLYTVNFRKLNGELILTYNTYYSSISSVGPQDYEIIYSDNNRVDYLLLIDNYDFVEGLEEQNTKFYYISVEK